MSEITWHKEVEGKFNQMIEKVPVFMRPIAKDAVSKKAVELVTADGRTEIGEKDLIDAFFAATPGGFHGPMKCDMEEIGLDYEQYGYEKDEWKSIMIKKNEPGE